MQQDNSNSLEAWKIALIAISIFAVFALCVCIAFEHSRRKALYINNNAESHTLHQHFVDLDESTPPAALRSNSQTSLQLNPSGGYVTYVLVICLLNQVKYVWDASIPIFL